MTKPTTSRPLLHTIRGRATIDPWSQNIWQNHRPPAQATGWGQSRCRECGAWVLEADGGTIDGLCAECAELTKDMV